MSNEEFHYCDKYGLVRNYKLETDFVITAKQIEKLLKELDTKIECLELTLKPYEDATVVVTVR